MSSSDIFGRSMNFGTIQNTLDVRGQRERERERGHNLVHRINGILAWSVISMPRKQWPSQRKEDRKANRNMRPTESNERNEMRQCQRRKELGVEKIINRRMEEEGKQTDEDLKESSNA